MGTLYGMTAYPPMQPPYPPMQPTPAASQPPQHSRVTALVLSFFSADLYRDVARRWRGIGFLYLMLLLAVSWLPVSIRAQVGFSKWVRQDAARTLAGFPAVTIKDGVVSIDRPEPYLWRDPESGEVILYVDTTGAFDLPAGANARAKLGRSSVTVQQNKYETRTHDLSQIKSFSVDANRVQGWLQAATSWIGVGLFAVGFLATLLWHLFQILIYGLIGLLLATMFGARLDYPALLRLSAVAITPAILLDTLLELFGAGFPFSGFVFLLIEIAYLAFAVRSNADAAQPAYPGYAAPGQGYAGFPPQPPLPQMQPPPPPPPGNWGWFVAGLVMAPRFGPTPTP